MDLNDLFKCKKLIVWKICWTILFISIIISLFFIYIVLFLSTWKDFLELFNDEIGPLIVFYISILIIIFKLIDFFYKNIYKNKRIIKSDNRIVLENISSIKNEKKQFKFLKKIKKYFLSYDSKEYQRMLSGVRIYFSLMTQRSFINFIIFTMSMIAFIFIFFNLYLYYEQISTTIDISIIILIFFFIPLIISIMIMHGNEFGFKLFKGYLIALRNPTFLAFSLFIIITEIIYVKIIESSIFLVGYFFLWQLFTIIVQMILSLKNYSLISYAKEKLDEISDIMNEKKNKIPSSKFDLFYYSIYTYYRRLTREIKSRYKDDMILHFQFDKIPMLAPQIYTKDIKKMERLKNILTKLEQFTYNDDSDDFIKIMEDIDYFYRDSLSLPNDIMIIHKFFRGRTSLEKLKFYLIPLFPIITIAINLYLNS